jgi:2-keto-4-pentenoate hydratase/2-oxohepta-3-ene-1,7-dioic acid hydratase in catechol pathway
MRVVRVRTEDGATWGALDGDEVRRLPAGPFVSLLEPAYSLGRLEDLDLLAPASPSKIVCVGRNYPAHAAEHGTDVPSQPLLFLKPPSAVLSPGGTIVLPELSNQVEHESELALVIGSHAFRVSEDQAWQFVLGVTCGNDVTARDLQRSDSQWTRGKGFDTFCPLGPWLVTGMGEEEVGNLALRCRVNTELRQSANTGQMAFSPAFLISYITQVMTLEAGDVVMTGTPAGVGPLEKGDTVEVEIEGIGTLVNTVR